MLHSAASHELTVVRAEPAHAAAVSAIINHAADRKRAYNDPVAWETWSIADAREAIEQHHVFVAYLGMGPVGAVILKWEDPLFWGEQPPTAGYLRRLATVRRPDTKERRVGARLINCASEVAERRGCTALRLDCPAANQGLRQYYEGEGFTYVGQNTLGATTDKPEYTYARYERPIPVS